MSDSTLSTLQNIQIKVRRLTRSISASQLPDSDLNSYINNFVLYDFPEHLRLFNLRRTFTFYTQPNVATYATNDTDPNSPFYNFKNLYTTIHEPAYIAGYLALFSQSREQFFGIYPQINFINSIGVSGDGATTSFSGTLTQVPVQQNQVMFTSIDTSGTGIILIDYPVSNTTGALGLVGEPQTLPSPYGSINYVTGAFSLNFPIAPGQAQPINSQTVPYNPSLPQAICYFNDSFILRPIPDQSYRVNVEVYVRPTELLSGNQSPELAEWWQYIAYGAAKKVFEDRMDMDSVQLIMPEFKKQEMLIQRRTIVQMTKQRVATIYTENTQASGTGGGWGWGGGLF